jgi:hypothetical protein
MYVWRYTNPTETVYEGVDYTSKFRRVPIDSINAEETLANATDYHFIQQRLCSKELIDCTETMQVARLTS